MRDVIGRRLARLPEQTRDTLALAAVIGDHFELAVLVAAAGEAEIATLRALDPAIAARLVTESAGTAPGHRFVHALVRATLYDSLPRATRVDLHRRAGAAIEAIHGTKLDDHLPALAHHCARAGSGMRGQAVRFAARAGDRALAQLAHQEAAGWYTQALDLLDASSPSDDVPPRHQLLISLGEAQRRAGDPAHRETLLEAVHEAGEQGDAEAMARAALANSRGFWSALGRVDAERVATLEAALAAAGPEATPARARLLAILAGEKLYGPEWRRYKPLVDEALRIARALGDGPTLARVLLARVNTGPGAVRERLAETAELIAIAEAAGDPGLSCLGWVCRFIAAMEAAEIDEARHCSDTAQQLADELRQPALRWFVSLPRVTLALLAGDLPGGERLTRETVDLGRSAGQPDAEVLYRNQLALVRFEQGRLGEFVEEAVEIAGTHAGAAAIRSLLALCYCEAGRHEEALELLKALSAQLDDTPKETGWARAVAQSALVCSQLGDGAQADRLLELFRPYTGQVVSSGVVSFGGVDFYLAILAATAGRTGDAGNHFTAAEALHARIGAPTWLARTRLEWARMLSRRAGPGDGERARELAGAALAAAEELGMARVAQQAREVLAGR